MITKQQVIEILGPCGIHWDYEELSTVRNRFGRTRTKLQVWVRRFLIPGELDNEVNREKRINLQIWGTAGPSAPAEDATLKGIENALMWLGLLPELAIAHGLDGFFQALGPAGLNWDFTEVETRLTVNNRLRCKVEVSCLLSALSLSGDEGEGEITRRVTGETDVRGSSTPEDDVFIVAVRNCLQWMAVVPDDPETLRASSSDEDPELIWESVKPQSWLTRAAKKVGFGVAAGLLGLIGK